MRRVVRHVFTVLAALSLLLFVVVVLWPAWPIYIADGSLNLPLGHTQHRALVYVRELPDSSGPRLWYFPTGLLAAIVAAVLAVPPIMWCVQRQRGKDRRAAGLCSRCGYDLRAHSGGERCPECGRVVGTSAE